VVSAKVPIAVRSNVSLKIISDVRSNVPIAVRSNVSPNRIAEVNANRRR
jgi:hypothetical protein